jgi:PIN domain nuclease of toxin-antitoxin system
MLLDASAVLAYLHREPGWDLVETVLLDGSAQLSSVNLAEVIAKLCDHGMAGDAALAAVQPLGLKPLTFAVAEGVLAGQMRRKTRSAGLSLGDRACLATARLKKLPVLTADRPWLGLAEALELDIRCIRPDAH